MRDRNVVLILTEEFDPHTDIMVKTLQERAPEVEVFRFHPEMFPEQAGLEVRLGNDGFDARLRFYHRTIDMTRVRSVWIRRPKPPVLNAAIPEQYREWSLKEVEAALHGMYYSLDALVVNPYEAKRLASNKVYQLRRAIELGLKISPTLISNLPEGARAFYGEQKGEVVFKPLSHPIVVKRSQEGVRVLYTQKIQRTTLEGENGDRIQHVPVQLQRLVKKECEVRVTVVGSQVFAAAIRSQSQHVDVRRWSETEPEYSIFQLPEQVEQQCVELVRRLGLYYGAIDLLLTEEGEFIFLEVNPSGQFYWIQRETGLPIIEALADMLVAGTVGSELPHVR